MKTLEKVLTVAKTGFVVIGLTALPAMAGTLDDVQAPRTASQDVQAPRTASQDIQAPRTASQDVQAPRTASQDIQAPRG